MKPQSMEPAAARPRRRALRVASAMLLVTGAFFVAVPPTIARVPTCNGLAATVIGPTQGHDTTGTAGKDVIVAPISMDSVVSGLDGDDTICLVDGEPGRAQGAYPRVRAGAGGDTVLNESTQDPALWSL